MKDAKVWLRIGDNSDYEAYPTPYEAGYEVGQYTQEVPRYRRLGIEVTGFEGHNYISLFWGDDEAQPVTDAELNASDKLDFEQGMQAAGS